MRRTAKVLGWIVALLICLPLVLVICVLVAANTGAGQRAIERLVPRLTEDTVRIAGLVGHFPHALRANRIELRDTQGTYATIDNAVFDWSPLQLLHWHILIDRLAPRQNNVVRGPVQFSLSSSGSLSIPAPVTLQTLQIDRLDISDAIAGIPVAVTINGSGAASSLSDF